MMKFIQELRENTLFKSIYKTFSFKMLGAILSFVIIPVSIKVLDNQRYGIWATILSFVSWFAFFDFGLGNGLRNKVAKVIAEDKYEEANRYISTAYAVIAMLSIFIIIIVLCVFPFLNWKSIFNTQIITDTELMYSMLFISIFFIINLLLSNINSIFYAIQKPELASLSNVIMQIMFIVIVVSFKNIINNNLILFSFVYGLCLVFSNILMSILFFKKNKRIILSLKYVNKKYVNGIMNLGMKFFIIQISSLVLLNTDNIVITQVLGPQYVKGYYTVYKLFSAVTMIHGGIILNSLWSRYTKAYAEKKYKWIIDTFNKTIRLFLVVTICIIALSIVSKPIIYLWIGEKIDISNSLIILMCIYTISAAWSGTYCSILNGLGKINIQLYTSIISGIVNIPLSILFSKYFSMGVSGVMLGTIVSLLPGIILLPIQAKYLKEMMKRECLEE